MYVHYNSETKIVQGYITFTLEVPNPWPTPTIETTQTADIFVEPLYNYKVDEESSTVFYDEDLQSHKDVKIQKSWSKYNTQNQEVLLAVDTTSNTDTSDLDSLQFWNSIIIANGVVLTPTVQLGYNRYNEYLNMMQLNKFVASVIEADIQALATVEEVNDYNIDAQSWVASPFINTI